MTTITDRLQARVDRLTAERVRMVAAQAAELAALDAQLAEAQQARAAVTPLVEAIVVKLVALDLVRPTAD